MKLFLFTHGVIVYSTKTVIILLIVRPGQPYQDHGLGWHKSNTFEMVVMNLSVRVHLLRINGF